MAHSAPRESSLAPSLLLSMPQLSDPNFRRTVILLCEHGEQGAFGLVMNRPTGVDAAEAVKLDPPLAPGTALQLWEGGPVEPQRGWIVLAESPRGEHALQIADGLYLSSSPTLLRTIADTPGTLRARVLTGYAGWGPGQLDMELAASAWLLSEVDVGLLFDVDPSQMWEAGIRRLGADPATLQMGHGVH
jgi:putative transcriptional regulator